MRVTVDPGICQGYACCLMEAPSVFDIDDSAGKAVVQRAEPPEEAWDEVEAAAADTLLMGDDPYTPIPYFWSDQFEAKVRFIGRAGPEDEVRIQEDGDSMVALFGRNGLLRGALCVNAARALATYRRAILDGTPWGDLVGDLVGAVVGARSTR
ncbi:ferredoxin [Nonomuraea sp. K274]|uniref:Ferredoxin n=1 Tax=Nonomuraea cypriaca TaxID=1187855 RepID=A0A931A4L7_9ACTN|nr:oxidoreductase C-terminal domain-containing protein [Nonomuraea cypriaca]MBF8185023.1 ferredoxin [Nonomuraea cypriaca]